MNLTQMAMCEICYDYYGPIKCIYCKIHICDKCIRYASENNFCSRKVHDSDYFYCSMSCILNNHNKHPDYFDYFMNRIKEKRKPEFYDEFYIHSQKIAYTQCVTPQIKKILNPLLQINDLCDVVCEFF